MDEEMAALKAAKKELRALMRQRLSQISQESIRLQSSLVTQLLLLQPEYRNAKRIGIYLSMPKGELSTGIIVKDAFRSNKEVFVPYIDKKEGPAQRLPTSVMEMVALESDNDYECLRPDAWGIPSVLEDSVQRRRRVLSREDKLEHGVDETETLDMIVMPGVAFDRGLRRLGHGKGFYDDFLARYHESKSGSMPSLVGLALGEQLLPENQIVPTNASDWKLDALVVGDGLVLRRVAE